MLVAEVPFAHSSSLNAGRDVKESLNPCTLEREGGCVQGLVLSALLQSAETQSGLLKRDLI